MTSATAQRRGDCRPARPGQFHQRRPRRHRRPPLRPQLGQGRLQRELVVQLRRQCRGCVTGIANYVATGFDDNFFIDYTLTKKFGKLELGVVGSYDQDIGGPIIRANSVSVGGLVDYDFGTFTLQGYVTREVEVHNGGWGLGTPASSTTVVANANRDYETRGYIRLIVPLYVAPTAPKAPVVARY